MNMAHTDTWARRQVSSLFGGREGGNNDKIMELLSREMLTTYQIAHALGKGYSTIFDRLRDLEATGIIKKVGETEAAKTHNKIPLWGLTSGGVYAGVFYSANKVLKNHALNICRRFLLRGWDTFSELYQLPKSSHHLRDWISSEQGIHNLLSFFGHSFLDTEAQIVLTYRRMIDLGISLYQSDIISAFIILAYYPNVSVVRSKEETEVKNFADALRELGTIASKLPRFRKLHDAIEEANAPLLEWLRCQQAQTTSPGSTKRRE
jgi:hypothetical protein